MTFKFHFLRNFLREKMGNGEVNPFLLTLLTVMHFTLAALLPIYNKELFINYPFPLYATFLQMSFSIIPSFLIAWGAKKFPCSISWAIPPIEVIPRLVIHGFLYGGMMLTGNLGYYVSDLDFAVLFRLSTIASSSLCGLIFLGERLSLWSTLSIFLVVGGLIALTSNFQWSTAKMPTADQLLVQISAVFTSSLASLFLKLTISVLNETPNGHEPFTLLFWRFLFGSLSKCPEDDIPLLNTCNKSFWSLLSITNSLFDNAKSIYFL